MGTQGDGIDVGISVPGIRTLETRLRNIDRSGDHERNGLPDLGESPHSVRAAVDDLCDVLSAGSHTMNDELESLAAFVDGAVEAYVYLDRSAVTGHRS